LPENLFGSDDTPSTTDGFIVFLSESEDTPRPLFSLRYEDRDGARYVTVTGETDLVVKEESSSAWTLPDCG
jgi:hypothetical protein